jgi:GNAT superfamily N-acetyltransferase
MAWTLTEDVAAYRDATADLLRGEPERYNVFVTILDRLARLGGDVFGEPAVLGWWAGGAAPAVQAAFLQTPPREMLITALPAGAAAPLAQALADRGAGPPGVNGAEPDATAFARAWSLISGQSFAVHERHRLHRLGSLVPPDPAPDGIARLAGAADRDVVRSFSDAFADDVSQPRQSHQLTDDRLEAGGIMLWEVAGEPVSMAGVSDPAGGVARVGPVYTPKDRRGRGYGGAVTAAITQLALARGATSVILYTDLANPTSNALYARLGYRPAEDQVILRFQ